MMHPTREAWVSAGRSLALAALLLLALPGCTTSATSPVETVDAAPDTRSSTDTAYSPGAPDAIDVVSDVLAADTSPVRGDATTLRADAIAPDAEPVSDDAEARDTASARPDTAPPDTAPDRFDVAVPDTAVIRTDSAAPEVRPPAPDAARPDVKPDTRGDSAAADATGTGAETALSICALDGSAPPLVHLTPLELKTLLDSAEDPFLINVKGESIGLIPGTDAVLVDDIPGIEALVGGDHCANIILYCQGGSSSQSVATQLIAKGYMRVRDLAGGITAWKNAGYPTE
jgi:rhodanese-related sulfurtransferase